MPAQIIVDILINTALYGLLMVGYQFNSTLKQTSNFAFGALIAVAGYLFWATLQAGWEVLLSILFTLLGTTLVTVIFEKVFYIFSNRNKLGQETILIVGIALLEGTEALIQIIFGASTKAITILSPIYFKWNSFRFTQQQVILCFISIILICILTIWLYKTMSGLVFRATEESPVTAQSITFSSSKSSKTAAIIAVISASVSGIFIATESSLSPHIGTGLVITAFILATLGGKNVRIWPLICLAFASFEVISAWYFGSTLTDVIVYSLIFLYLVRERFVVYHLFNKMWGVYA